MFYLLTVFMGYFNYFFWDCFFFISENIKGLRIKFDGNYIIFFLGKMKNLHLFRDLMMFQVLLIEVFAKIIDSLKLIEMLTNNQHNKRADKLLFKILLLKLVNVHIFCLKVFLSKNNTFQFRNILFNLMHFYLFLLYKIIFH